MNLDVIIIGTGTAALAAAREVSQATHRFIIVSNGIYGTTCVRAGCMPSKIFIQGAQFFQLRHMMQTSGITGTENLRMNKKSLLAHVRGLRDHFLKRIFENTKEFRDHIIEGHAFFLSPNEIRLNGVRYSARNIILATGSSPIIPPACKGFAGNILTSDTLFEQESLPDAIAVMGMSVLGAEMVQAFARLGMTVSASHENGLIGGLTDPEVNAYALKILRAEMEITLHQPPERCLKAQDDRTLFVAQSRKANLEHLGLVECGIIQPGDPVLNYNPETMQVGNLPLFVAGDVKSGRSILHEAADEGRIAGYNASHASIKSFKRRTPLQITHTEPPIVTAGKIFAELDSEKIAIGKAHYDDQGRAKIMGEACGVIRIYADKQTGELLGGELFAPGGESLAHLLACLISRRATFAEALEIPFYHPSLEEGLRSALESLQ